ncbi:hypothetical protein B0T25DRAFT_560588 [Lasiosphaeria hispida]|uniref:F-box domain-containing protein n=1 Tax=Lasiosphaeria hispida TaxID=260671 RepID=A0AAJ0H538_9PEZI|nr:hypothetical protein B0T25DRAFT_560588 [Lasiosphaeria hispida]
MVHLLLNLSEELLLEIMKHLDSTSIQCLRRTSRIFLRLFSDRSFAQWHHPNSGLPRYTTKLPWYRGSPAFERQAYDKSSSFRYLMLLDETRKQCLSCRNANIDNPRKAWDLVHEYLFCAACLIDHPKAFFPATERGEKKKTRACVGHTGYIRLCEHEVITRDNVAEAWGELLALGPQSGENTHVWVRRCLHPSHNAPTSHDALEKSVAERMHPTAVLRRGGNAVVLDMAWTGHLRVPHNSDISADDMAACLPELRRGAAEHIVPQAGPGMLPEMRCFDPNRCGCLDWGGKYPPNSRWACMPAWSGGAGCRGDSSRRLLPFGDETVTEGGMDEMQEAHVTVTGLSSTFGDASRWSVSVTHCPDRDKCLRFSYHRRIACGPYWQRDWTTLDYSWLEALDPDSYGLWRDKSTKGTFWCLDPTCTNYYRYLERPLVRKCYRAPGGVFQRPPRVKDAGVWRIHGVPYRIRDSNLILAKQADLKKSKDRAPKPASAPKVKAPVVDSSQKTSKPEGFWKKCGRKLRYC